MTRKKWTQQIQVSDAYQAVRLRKKWQIALRRYLLEGQKSAQYAPFFGLDVVRFRQWIECQFSAEQSWDSFSKNWHLDHLVPPAYFDEKNDDDLRLCWSFINIRPAKLSEEKHTGGQVNLLAAKNYFQALYQQTNLSVCRNMVHRLAQMEVMHTAIAPTITAFLATEAEAIETMAAFTFEDFNRLNSGVPFSELAFEKAFLKKFA